MAPHADRDVEVQAVTDTQGVVVLDPIVSKATNPAFGINDVLPHRQASKPVNTGVAAFSSAEPEK